MIEWRTSVKIFDCCVTQFQRVNFLKTQPINQFMNLPNYEKRPELGMDFFYNVQETLARWLPSDAGPQVMADWNSDQWHAAEWITYWQGALPWFVERLGEEGLTLAPADLGVRLSAVTTDSRERTRRMLGDIVEILQALQEEGIDAVALKGAVIAPRHYGDPLMRPLGDLDILIHRADSAQVDEVMQGLDFRFLKRTAKDVVYIRGQRQAHPWSPDNVHPVEIQQNCLNQYAGLVYDLSPLIWNNRSLQVLWDGCSYRLPNTATLFHHVCAHATEDILLQKAKLSQLLDVATISAQMTSDDWQAFLAQVSEDGARFIYPAMAVCDRFGSLFAPNSILEHVRELSPQKLQEWLRNDDIVKVFDVHAEKAVWHEQGVARLLVRSPLEFRLAQLRLAFPSRWHFRLNKYPRLIASPFWPLAYLLVSAERLRGLAKQLNQRSAN